jgi:hypothetical protein
VPEDEDTAWKQLLETLFQPFLQFFFPTIHDAIDWSVPPEFLNTEFQRLVPGMRRGRRITDLLAKLRFRDGTVRWLLVHVEIQGHGETAAKFNERVLDCHFLIRHRHRCSIEDIVSVAVVIDDSPAFRPGRYLKRLLGVTSLFEFPVVRLIDLDGRRAELEASDNPFAVVTLAYLAMFRASSEDERFATFRWLLRLARELYNRGIRAENTGVLVRFLTWILKPSEARLDEAFGLVLRDFEGTTVMEFFTPFEIRALERGRAEGKTEGKAEGLREGARALLRRCYGQGGAALVPALDATHDLDRLQAILDALDRAATLDEIKVLIEGP